MIKNILKILIIAVVCCNFVDLQESSNVFPLCSRREPDIGQCILKSLNKLRPNLASGRLSPDFIISPLDPFVLSHFELGDGRFLKATFYDTHIIGATKFKIKGLRAYFEGSYLKFMPHIEYDRLDIKTKYSLNGILPLPQVGEISLSLLDLKIRGNGSVRLYKKNGIEYFKIEQAKLMFDSIKVGNVKYSLPVGRMREAGFIMNLFLKTFGEMVLKTGYKIFEKRIDDVHLDVANDFIKDVPVSYFFSE